MGINDYNLEKAKDRIEKNDNILEENKELILEHDRQLELNEYSESRRYKYLTRLPYLAEQIDVSFKEAEKKDIEDIILYLQRREDINSTTRADYKVLLKRFMKAINGGGYPESVKWVSTEKYNQSKDLIPEDLLTEKDIQTLREACKNPRDKALIQFFWEVGPRVSEAMELKIKHFKDAEQYMRVHIPATKTKGRKLFIVTCVPYVNKYLSYHPRSDDPDAPFFVNIGTRNQGEAMEYQAIRKRLRDIKKRTDIEKSASPHHFRKSSATFKAGKGWSEYELCSYFGWVVGSQVVQRYIAASGRSTEDRIKQQHGIEDEEDMKPELTPEQCPRCYELLEEGISFCPNCGFALTKGAAEKIESGEEEVEEKTSEIEEKMSQKFIEFVSENPEIKEKFKESLED